MALSRDSRMDRRRRVLLDASSTQQVENGSAKRNTSGQNSAEPNGKKSAGYSQDVRQTCGTRLVQLIPVRRRSFIGLVTASVVIALSLIVVHYMVYVNGWLPWYGHPLSIALDLIHPQSIASWLGSHLWLLCLGTTLLTFQLRRHKLDDYKGEYRLWFWLVFTCILASIDSTTHLSELLGMGLDRWSQANIGWSGKAVVLATMSTLIGMLGLRLCSELKAVPLSLVCWLLGLTAWACSAALAQDKLMLDMAVQKRLWLRASLWLGGLTSIWIAAVAYLRFVYMDAQRRFLARGALARRATAIPLRERMKQTLAFGRRKNQDEDEEALEGEPAKAARWSMRRIFARRAKPAEEATASPKQRTRSTTASNANATATTTASAASPMAAPQPSTLNQAPPPPLRTQSNAAPLSTANRAPQAVTPSSQASTPSASAKPTTAPVARSPQDNSEGTEKRKSRWPFGFKLWPGKDIPEEEALEYRKVRDEERERLANEKKLQKEAAAAEKAAAKQNRANERTAAKQAKKDAKPDQPSSEKTGGGIGKKLLAPIAAVGGALKKIKLPSLAAFKLEPPVDGDTNAAPGGSTLKPVSNDRSIPSTNGPTTSSNQQRNSQSYEDDDDDADDDRQLSKADRKKLKRQNRAA